VYCKKDIRLNKEEMEEIYSCCRNGVVLQSLLRQKGASSHLLCDTLRLEIKTYTTSQKKNKGILTVL